MQARRRQRVFVRVRNIRSIIARACLGLAVALSVLGIVELGLMLFGVQANPPFFLEATDALGRKWWLTNPRAGEIWFRTAEWEDRIKEPRSLQVAAIKPAGTFRIIVLGGSAAYGTPFDDGATWSKMLEYMLNNAQDRYHVEVINCSIRATALSIYADILPQLRALEPDLFLLYTGHNEYYGVRSPGWLRARRTYRLLISLLDRPSRHPEDGIGIRAKEMFAPSSPVHGAVAKRFTSAFDTFVEAVRDVAVLAYVVPSNLTAFAPIESWAPADKSDLAARARNAVLEVEAEPGQPCGPSFERLRRLSEALPLYAGLHHALGLCLAADGKEQEAQEQFRLALEYDAVPLRAREEILRAIKESPSRHPGVTLAVCDPRGSMGGDSRPYFLDHVHLSMHGGYLVALEGASALARESRLGLSFDASRLPGYDAVLDGLGITELDEYLVLERMKGFYELSSIRGSPSNPYTLGRLNARMAAIWEGADEGVRTILSTAQKGGQELHALRAVAYLEAGDRERAIFEAKCAVAARPYAGETHLQLAGLLYEGKQPDKAREELALALMYGASGERARELSSALGLGTRP